jgi:hypothetical protein
MDVKKKNTSMKGILESLNEFKDITYDGLL